MRRRDDLAIALWGALLGLSVTIRVLAEKIRPKVEPWQ